MRNAIILSHSSQGKKQSVEDVVNRPMIGELEAKYDRRNDIDDREGAILTRGELCTGVTES